MPRRASRPCPIRRFARRSALWRVAITCLRVVALLCAMQLARVPHALVEGFAASDPDCAEGSCVSPCEAEREGRGCPPGCPTCHCEHAAAPAVLPAVPAQLTQLLPWPELLTWEPAQAGSPPSTAPPSLERPPRA